jgi:hypothetical protein
MIAVLLVAAIPMSVASCRTRVRHEVVPVTGRVLVNGEPPERALVVLHPVGGAAGAIRPHAEVGPDGRFTVSTYATNDGAPPGEYLVTVEWWRHSGRSGDDSPPTNRLPPRYAVPQTSGLHARVGNGPTDLPTFELSR